MSSKRTREGSQGLFVKKEGDQSFGTAVCRVMYSMMGGTVGVG